MKEPLEEQKPNHETVTFRNRRYAVVKEGLAKVLVPANALVSNEAKKSKDDDSSQSVFYNPIQQFNRDLSVLAIRAHGEDVVREREQKARVSRERNAKKRQAKKEVKRSNKVELNPDEVNGHAGTTSQPSARDSTQVSNADRPPTALKRGSNELIINESDEHDEGHPAKRMAPDPIATSEPLRNSEPTFENRPEVQTETTKNIVLETSTPSQQPRFRILDALSATGLRALRYAHELSFATHITANDLSPSAVEAIQTNIEYNELSSKITANVGNAMSHMYALHHLDNAAYTEAGGKYDVIDLDPYGTAAPFLDAAMHAVTDGGLLCVTCTDAGVWASNGYPEKAFALYGGTTMKGFHSHEGGLRLIIHAIATSAARYGLAIEPLLSLSIDYYARVFVRVRKSPAEVKFHMGKTMLVYTCDSGCGAWATQLLGRTTAFSARNGATAHKHSYAQGPSASPTCTHCGFKTHIAGPMYAGSLHNPSFIRAILNLLPTIDPSIYPTHDRIEGMLTTALEETLTYDAPPPSSLSEPNTITRTDPTHIDRYPFFFSPSALAHILRCRAPSEPALKGALRHAGYLATRSHAKRGSIRTTAPWSFVWHVMREWIRQKAPIKEGAITENMAGWKIMNSSIEDFGLEMKKEVVFDEQLGRDRDARKLVRYQENPREDWGPQRRAKG